MDRDDSIMRLELIREALLDQTQEETRDDLPTNYEYSRL